MNHPFRASKGTVGTPIGGVEVRIAPDGEILVRGENVTTGYFNAAGRPPRRSKTAGSTRETLASSTRPDDCVIKGRKKEMIVTPQGLNVFPEDVERAVLAQPGVRDAGVIGMRVDGEERIHAVLLIEPGADVKRIVRDANATLEDHQRVWSTSVWPGEALPRTEGTQKLKRRELQRWASGEGRDAPRRRRDDPSKKSSAGTSPAASCPTTTTLDELGLSSLDRVEMLMALEEAFQTTLDESMLAEAKTIGEPETSRGRPTPSSRRAEVARRLSWSRRTRRRRRAIAAIELPLLESHAALLVHPPHQSADVDSPARAGVPPVARRGFASTCETCTDR